MLISWTVQNPGRFSRAIEKALQEARRGREEQSFENIEKLISAAVQMDERQIKARSLGPCISQAYSAQAEIRQRQGNQDSAAELLLRARQYSSLPVEAISFLASHFTSQNRMDDAAWGIFLDYLRSHPSSADDTVLQYLRSHYEVTPDISPTRYNYLLEKNRQILETRHNLPWNLFSVAYIEAIEQGKTPLQTCSPLIGKSNQDTQAKFYYARCLIYDNDSQKALELLNSLDRTMNSWWVYHYALGTVHFRFNHIEQSKQEFITTEQLAGHPVAVVQLHLGHLAFKGAELASAEEYYSSACEYAPDDWRGFYWLGRIKLVAGKLKEAGQLFENAAMLSHSPEPIMAMAITHEMSAEWGIAASLYDQCRSYNPDLTVAIFRKGICLAMEGKLIEAGKCFSQAASNKSTRDMALFYQGIIAASKSDTDTAIDAWETIQSEPWSSYARQHLAMVLRSQAEYEFDTGQYDQAINIWAKSLPALREEEKTIVERNIAEARFRKACTLSESNDRLNAIREAIEADTSSRAQYYASLLSMAQNKPESCDFSKVANVEDLDTNRCLYHQAIALLRQGHFDEKLLIAVAESGGKYSLVAKRALISGYSRNKRDLEALLTLTEMLS